MNCLNKKRLDELKEKHKDILENKAIDNLIELKRKGDARTLECNPNDYPVMSEGAYSEKYKYSLPYFVKKLI